MDWIACLSLPEFLGFLLMIYGVPVIVVVVAAVGTVRGVSSWRKERMAIRRARGICERCGYDLRATPSRCPECGTFVREFASRAAISEAAAKWCEEAAVDEGY